MKKIRNIILAFAVISTMLTGALGINAWYNDDTYSWENIVKDPEILKQVYGEYLYAYSKDHGGTKMLEGYVLSSNSIQILLAEPIVFKEESKYGNEFYGDDGFYTSDNIYGNEVISGSIPTPEDFPELEGLSRISFYLTSDENNAAECIANHVYLDFENYDYAIAAYNNINQESYYNPIISDKLMKTYTHDRTALYLKGKLIMMTLDIGFEVPAPVMGDVNCDNKVSVTDLVSCAKYISKKTQGFGSFIGEYQADCNQDGKIDGEDLLYMIKIMTGEIIL